MVCHEGPLIQRLNQTVCYGLSALFWKPQYIIKEMTPLIASYGNAGSIAEDVDGNIERLPGEFGSFKSWLMSQKPIVQNYYLW